MKIFFFSIARLYATYSYAPELKSASSDYDRCPFSLLQLFWRCQQKEEQANPAKSCVLSDLRCGHWHRSQEPHDGQGEASNIYYSLLQKNVVDFP